MGVLPVPPSVRLPTLTTGTPTRERRPAAVVTAVPPADGRRIKPFRDPKNAAQRRRPDAALPAADKFSKPRCIEQSPAPQSKQEVRSMICDPGWAVQSRFLGRRDDAVTERRLQVPGLLPLGRHPT